MLDALCHLHLPGLFERRKEVAARAARAGVDRILTASTDAASWDRVALCRPFGPVALGVHPWFAAGGVEGLEERLGDADAVGEVGLDPLRGPIEVQLPVLRRQLELAMDADLPVVLHCVRAWHLLLPELRRVRVRGLVHAYGGGPHLVQDLVDLGLHLSVGRAALRPTARLLQALERIPAERLLVESDAPDQLGEPAEAIRVVQALRALGHEPRGQLFSQSTV